MSREEDLHALLAEIAAGPEGPEIGAFFDFDGTLIAGYSAEAFVLDAIRRRKVDPQMMVRSLLAGLDMHLRGSDVTALMEIAAKAGKGHEQRSGFRNGGDHFILETGDGKRRRSKDLVSITVADHQWL